MTSLSKLACVLNLQPRQKSLRSHGSACALALLLVGAGTEAVLGQALERNLPPPVESRGGGLVFSGQDLAGSTDTTPLGADLAGIHLIGVKEKVTRRPQRGVTVGDIGPIPHQSLQDALSPFIGQPMSRKLVSDVQSAIARVYRQAGFPFVSVTIPPHDASRGVLQIRVVEFRTGQIKLQGPNGTTPSHLAGHIRAVPGDRIAAEKLEEDLDWLNRNPYRTVQGVFAPGDVIGTSDLTLSVDDRKPWQVFAGYSNTGSQATGLDRYFVGAGAALSALNDTTVSYQFTGSSDFWSDPRLGTGFDAARYTSHAGRITVPTAPRQALEFIPNFVSSRSNPDPFLQFNNTTFELPIIYRSAISNILPGVHFGDVYGGVEFKHVERTTYFTGIEVGEGKADLFQLVLGWAHRFSDPYGRTSVDFRIKTNPGGGLGGNNSDTWNLFTSGRVQDVNYTYGLFDISRATNLPAGFSWITQFTALASGSPLPDTEQLALGGFYGVRGYTLDDGAVDSGFYWRNELRLPVIALPGAGGLNGELSPYAFFDYGQGRNINWPLPNTTLASVGLGVDYRLSNVFSASLAAGYALHDARHTQEGDWSFHARILMNY